jgi:hypothetical protein
MKLSAFKNQLDKISQLNFVQPNGTFVPRHFHITEAGLVTKHFIDCGGTVRTEKAVNLQIWVAQDFDHRLEPLKLKKILALSENLFGQEDLEVEVEFQTDTIGRYGVEFDKENFLLTTKQTDCLAKELCGLPLEKTKLVLSELQSSASSCCTPGGGCC